MESKLATIILAAGKGTRLKQPKAKVLLDISGEPMVLRPILSCWNLSQSIFIVVSFAKEQVIAEIESFLLRYYSSEEIKQKIIFVDQEKPRGTGHAVNCAVNDISKQSNKFENVLVLNGDLPLITNKSIENIYKSFKNDKYTAACVSFNAHVPGELGRIVKDPVGKISCIKEFKDASEEEKKINEVNGGVYFLSMAFLAEHIVGLKSNNAQGEFYLTDLFNSSLIKNIKVGVINLKNSIDLSGVNDTFEYSTALLEDQKRIQKAWSLKHGVIFQSPSSTFIDRSVKFTGNSFVGTGCVLKGDTVIGDNVTIEGNNLIVDSEIGQNSKILWGSTLEGSVLKDEAIVGPMARLRPGTILDEKVKIGNFVETKKAHLHSGAKASHLTYLGDCEVGKDSNIGCGTITCNYDGVNKHKTIIGKNVFVGSDTQLIAPVEIGDGAFIASGTTVDKKIPKDALALSRPDLVIKQGYALKLKRIKKKK